MDGCGGWRIVFNDETIFHRRASLNRQTHLREVERRTSELLIILQFDEC
jgi:hypothetical protein